MKNISVFILFIFFLLPKRANVVFGPSDEGGGAEEGGAEEGVGDKKNNINFSFVERKKYFPSAVAGLMVSSKFLQELPSN